MTRELFRDAFERATTGIAIVDPDGVCVMANDALCTLSGYDAEELAGSAMFDLAVPAARVELEGIRCALLAGEAETASGESLLRRKDGSKRWVRLAATLVRDTKEAPLHFVVSLVDIGALRASQERLSRSQSIARLGSWEWDIAADEVTWSDELYRLSGVDPAEHDTTYAGFLALVHEEDRPRIEQAMTAALDGTDRYRVEIRLVRPDGTICAVEAIGQTDRDETGRPVRLVGVARDITAEREAAGELARLRGELTEAQRLEAIGRLAGGIAHEINNALTAIGGYAELVLSELEPASPARRDVEALRRVAGDAAALPRQLLAFARRQSLRPREVDIEASVVEAEPLLRHVLAPDCTLKRVATPTGVRATFDPGQLQVVLVNLALNAKEAMLKGGVLTIETDRRAVSRDDARRHGIEPGMYAVLSVSDTGTGMDEETRRRAVEPFFSTKPGEDGAGLGLATVYGVVTQSGGAVVIDSDPGSGTRIDVLIPAVTVEVVQGGRAGPATPAETTVLVVEDQPAVLDIAVRALRTAGYMVVAAASAVEGRALAQEHDVDLLVSDVRLADGSSGIELARGLREQQSALPVVLISGYADVELEPGDHFFLPKPFSPSDLRAMAAAALGGSQASPS